MNKENLIIYNAILIQFITAMFLLAAHEPLRVASLGIFYDLFSVPQLGAMLMLLGVVCSVVGVMVNVENRARFLFFIPQYVFLLLTAGSALSYIIQGQYADGVIRPWQFIFIDQLPSLAIALLYTASIFNFRKRKPNVT